MKLINYKNLGPKDVKQIHLEIAFHENGNFEGTNGHMNASIYFAIQEVTAFAETNGLVYKPEIIKELKGGN